MAGTTSTEQEWMERAFAIVKRIARRKRTFTTDDVWEKLGADMPPEARALGAVMRVAAARGICRSSGGYRQSQRPECHKRPVLVWRSALAR